MDVSRGAGGETTPNCTRGRIPGLTDRSSQARHFKGMLKEADHLEKVKRLRIGDADVESLKPAYEVSVDASAYIELRRLLRPRQKTALRHLKEAYARG